MVKPKQINLLPKELLESYPSVMPRFVFVRRLGEIYKTNKFLGRIIAAVLVVVVVVSMQFLAVYIYKRAASISKNKVQQAKVKLNRLQSEYLQLEEIKAGLVKEQTQVNEHMSLLLSSSAGDKRYFKLLAFVTQLIPQDLWINRFILSGDLVQIEGSALDNQLITQFMDKLDGSDIFKNSRFIYTEKQIISNQAVYNFQITTEPAWNANIFKNSEALSILNKQQAPAVENAAPGGLSKTVG